jgi:hypothetical protein
MKLFSMHALVLGTYAIVLGIYAWSEHEPALVAVGLLPVMLFTLARALDNRFEKKGWSWARSR